MFTNNPGSKIKTQTLSHTVHISVYLIGIAPMPYLALSMTALTVNLSFGLLTYALQCLVTDSIIDWYYQSLIGFCFIRSQDVAVGLVVGVFLLGSGIVSAIVATDWSGISSSDARAVYGSLIAAAVWFSVVACTHVFTHIVYSKCLSKAYTSSYM